MYSLHYKAGLFWVLMVFIIMLSMAYAEQVDAKSVQQFNQEQDLIAEQQELDFPTFENWPAGNYEDAVWVEPDQTLSPIGLPGVELDAPKLKINLDSATPETSAIDYDRIQKGVAKIELFGWD